MNNHREHWLELRGSLLVLIEELAENIDDKNLSLLRDFVENREFGVALEWLHSYVREHSIPTSTHQDDRFKDLAKLMGMPLA